MAVVLQLVLVLLSVAFLTLFERKLLSASATRLGPDQAVAIGLLQPLLDGGKLLLKSFDRPERVSLLFSLFPALLFMAVFLIFLALPSTSFLQPWRSLFYLLLFFGFMVYRNILSG